MGLWRTTGVTQHEHALVLFYRTCGHLYISYGGDTGQCLTTKPQGRQRVQVVDMADLAGREPLQRESSLLGIHAAAVIGHLHETPPAVDQFDVNTRTASIESIVDEFLDHRGGALDDFPSSNAAGRGRIKALNARRHAGTSPFPTSVRA